MIFHVCFRMDQLDGRLKVYSKVGFLQNSVYFVKLVLCYTFAITNDDRLIALT